MEDVTAFMKKGLEEGIFPGAVLAIFNSNNICYHKSFGYARIEGGKRKIKDDTIFDLASLTKVVATTTGLMLLLEAGEINLYDYLKEYFPEAPADKNEITIMHLMTHTSGMQAIVELWNRTMSYREKIKYLLDLPLQYSTGEKMVYSDPNFILLGELIQRVSGKGLDEFSREYIFKPLKMRKTDFNPRENIPEADSKDFAATEFCKWRDNIVEGEVHDKNSYYFNGISGHAGLFSTADDLINFAIMMLNRGKYDGNHFLTSRSVELIRKDWLPKLTESRGLGWDLAGNYRSSGGVLLSDNAFGHTGFTGTSIWLDPDLDLGIILLTNRVHPDRSNVKIISFRPRLHNLIANWRLRGKFLS